MGYGLVFFAFALVYSCSAPRNENVAIQWRDKKAVGISIPENQISDIESDSLSLIEVRLASGQKTSPILGNFVTENDGVVFQPLVPFTRGLHYEIRVKNKLIANFQIPQADPANAPVLSKIFPSPDTLPENLLKIYLHFSHPMREGQSGKYVVLVKNKTDTIPGAFLDLQPELWNENRTILTLWLDPGRIKRDLRPNQLLGAPLHKNTAYHIAVSSEWQDQIGGKLSKDYVKNFVTTLRDSQSPVPALWKTSQPASGTNQPFKIDFRESMDHSLLTETLSIQKENGIDVGGKWQIGPDEKSVLFIPGQPWKSGKYKLHIEPRLEDLAGNNLMRPFDRDISGKMAEPDISPKFFQLFFVVLKR